MRETGRKGDEKCAGGGRRGGGKREEKGKLRNIAQYFATEKIQRGGSQQIQGGKDMGSVRFKLPCLTKTC